MPSPVAQVREFNRFYTATIGVLQEKLLRTPYSLTEARVLFELAQRTDTEVAELRRTLGLDAGYVSRLLARFESDGLVHRAQSATDARRQVIRLTEAGQDAYQRLDERSGQEIQRLLDRLGTAEQRRLLRAMTTIRALLAPSRRGPALGLDRKGSARQASVMLRGPEPGDYGWVVARHGARYAEEYGWDAGFEALVARIVADFAEGYDPARERVWLAEVDGQRAGCVFCVRRDDTTAQLRLLLVEPDARGMGVGSRLVGECVEFARSAGYRRLVLWTNDVLADARRIYQRAGFRLVSEKPHHSYGKDLVGQDWALDL
jgi:DNA-binding MarR family transcriptional regulator/GNAT superfamily N-acetyltransferase